MDPDSEREKWWIPALISLLLVLTTSSSVIEEEIIQPKLHDGSIVELARYTFVYDALEHINQQDSKSVISIGSSKMREAFNGEEIQKNSATKSVEFYNLGIASDRPYFRAIQIEPIIESKPEILVIEIGPNSFSRLNSPLSQVSLDRMNALLYDRPLSSGEEYRDILDNEDKINLHLDFKDRISNRNDASFEAFELNLETYFGEENEGWDCDTKFDDVRCVPPPESELFHTYVKYPPQFNNAIEYFRSLNDGSLENFYGERLDNYLLKSYHQPEGYYNKNHQALDFIINETIESDIEILLVGIPYNPILKERLQPDAWQYYNESMEVYSQREDLHVIDLMWDPLLSSEHYFNDYSHFSREGENQFTRIITPILDGILVQRGVDSLPDFEYWEIENNSNPIISGNLSTTNPTFLNLSQPERITSGHSEWLGSSWEMVENETGSTIIRSTPNNNISSNEIYGSPRIDYCFVVNETDEYFIWLEMDPPDGGSDSVFLGANGEILSFGRRGVQSFQSGGGILWRQVGDDGERLSVILTEGIHCLNIWVREDGIGIHSVLFVVDEEFSPVG